MQTINARVYDGSVHESRKATVRPCTDLAQRERVSESGVSEDEVSEGGVACKGDVECQVLCSGGKLSLCTLASTNPHAKRLEHGKQASGRATVFGTHHRSWQEC